MALTLTTIVIFRHRGADFSFKLCTFKHPSPNPNSFSHAGMEQLDMCLLHSARDQGLIPTTRSLNTRSLKHVQYARAYRLCGDAPRLAESAADEHSLKIFELVWWSQFGLCGLACGTLIKKLTLLLLSLLAFFIFSLFFSLHRQNCTTCRNKRYSEPTCHTFPKSCCTSCIAPHYRGDTSRARVQQGFSVHFHRPNHQLSPQFT